MAFQLHQAYLQNLFRFLVSKSISWHSLNESVYYEDVSRCLHECLHHCRREYRPGGITSSRLHCLEGTSTFCQIKLGSQGAFIAVIKCHQIPVSHTSDTTILFLFFFFFFFFFHYSQKCTIGESSHCSPLGTLQPCQSKCSPACISIKKPGIGETSYSTLQRPSQQSRNSSPATKVAARPTRRPACCKPELNYLQQTKAQD